MPFWQLKTGASAQAGNRASQTRHYLQWWDDGPECNAVTSAARKVHHYAFFVSFLCSAHPPRWHDRAARSQPTPHLLPRVGAWRGWRHFPTRAPSSARARAGVCIHTNAQQVRARARARTRARAQKYHDQRARAHTNTHTHTHTGLSCVPCLPWCVRACQG